MGTTFLGRALRRSRAARARGAADLGASALEWAIIAAIVVVAASVIGGVVYGIVQDKSASLTACANQAVSATCSTGGTAGGGTTP
ncbi:hypothetical protein [Kineococcus glutinatus]|uniref:Pilus assembly protein Flp/PilA n=1 Tax=Kineococcus glutinatus TaxID=1070872 RepID=A0ABP8VGR2_9ACTN